MARLSLNTANATVKAGNQAEVVVRVSRLFNYDGEFKVELVLPPNTQGISAEEVTIPAGQNEAKLVIKAEADAKPGGRPNLQVKATALYKDTPLVQQTPLNVNVVK